MIEGACNSCVNHERTTTSSEREESKQTLLTCLPCVDALAVLRTLMADSLADIGMRGGLDAVTVDEVRAVAGRS